LRVRSVSREEVWASAGDVWADYYLAVLAIRLARQGDGVGAFQGFVGTSPVPGVKRRQHPRPS